ncbi:MAG: hypothetical protein WBQ34_08220 [Candidatus Acidiferrales bacterium]
MNAKVPAELGVPVIAPDPEARLRPGGREPLLTLQVYGALPPLAANVAVKVCPTVPPGRDVVETDNGLATTEFGNCVTPAQPQSDQVNVAVQISVVAAEPVHLSRARIDRIVPPWVKVGF